MLLTTKSMRIILEHSKEGESIDVLHQTRYRICTYHQIDTLYLHPLTLSPIVFLCYGYGVLATLKH